ncbi:hypothetical protein [Desulfosporosinus sp. SB140]|uniref:hypothetical protein n=1 Tax=Desulfosporosinus paludis TaxID=3115649 RepID=UPI00388DD53C
MQTIMEIFCLIEVLIADVTRYFPRNLLFQAVGIVEWAGYDPAKVTWSRFNAMLFKANRILQT